MIGLFSLSKISRPAPIFADSSVASPLFENISSQTFVDHGDHGSDFAFRDSAGRGSGDQVSAGDVVALAVDHHSVFAVESGTWRQIVDAG